MGHPFGEQLREQTVTRSLTQNTVAPASGPRAGEVASPPQRSAIASLLERNSGRAGGGTALVAFVAPTASRADARSAPPQRRFAPREREHTSATPWCACDEPHSCRCTFRNRIAG